MSGASDSLNRLVALAELLLKLGRDVEAAEDNLATLKEAYRRVEQESLPDLMRELGVDSFKLKDGTVITVGDDVQASISAERQPEAFAWLEAHGFGGIIKSQVVVPFARSELDQAKALADEIAAGGHTAAVESKVAPQTLKAFVREQLEAGRAIPADLFGIHPFSRAKVKAPRAK